MPPRQEIDVPLIAPKGTCIASAFFVVGDLNGWVSTASIAMGKFAVDKRGGAFATPARDRCPPDRTKGTCKESAFFLSYLV